MGGDPSRFSWKSLLQVDWPGIKFDGHISARAVTADLSRVCWSATSYACQAKYREGDVCYRCQTDLRQILAVERAAVSYQQQTVAALRNRRPQTAYSHAKHACELHRSAGSIKALALASLALRQFEEAVALWQEYRRRWPVEDGTI